MLPNAPGAASAAADRSHCLLAARTAAAAASNGTASRSMRPLGIPAGVDSKPTAPPATRWRGSFLLAQPGNTRLRFILPRAQWAYNKTDVGVCGSPAGCPGRGVRRARTYPEILVPSLTKRNLTFAQQYILISFVVMLASMLIIGLWVTQLIERGVTSQTAAVTALYVDSYLAPYVQELQTQPTLSDANIAFFERLMADNRLGQQIISLKIWAPDGTVVYSQDPTIIGLKYPIEAGLAIALTGSVHSERSALDRAEHATERQTSEALIETYAPIRSPGDGQIVAVSEFYQTTEQLDEVILAAQIRSWLVVGLVMLAVYLILAGLVRRASNTIEAQQSALQANVEMLSQLLGQNEILHDRVRRAAARTTALNERYLRRIAADLHDGPAQDLALALLRLEAVADACDQQFMASQQQPLVHDDLRMVRQAVASAMAELRTISAGLRLPELDPLTTEECVQRAVRDYEQKTERTVTLTCCDLPATVPLPVKITLYRVIREALNNSYYHAEGKQQAVDVCVDGQTLRVEVMDNGLGFDTQATLAAKGRLGVVSMAERVGALGGEFSLESEPGRGTIVRASLPLTIPEVENA